MGMANVYGADSPQAGASAGFSHAYGNAFNKAYTSEKVASVADVVYLGRIPAGTRVNSFELICAANAASTTCKIGYTPVSPSTTPVADDDYWIAAGQALSSAARVASSAQPVTFANEVDIILTVAGAAINTSKITVVVNGEILGVK